MNTTPCNKCALLLDTTHVKNSVGCNCVRVVEGKMDEETLAFRVRTGAIVIECEDGWSKE